MQTNIILKHALRKSEFKASFMIAFLFQGKDAHCILTLKYIL